MQIPRRKSEELRRKDKGPLYITAEGLTRLREKLLRLKKSLPDLIEETARTAAYGDRSENAEYKDAKANLRRANRQILYTEEEIRQAIVIAPQPNGSGTIELGSTVVLETNHGEKIFQIVGPHETNPAHGRISHLSPLGVALMHHRKGDVVTLETTRGSSSYRIREIN